MTVKSLCHQLDRTKQAVTSVIATIILIAGTLVLAIVVGAYMFDPLKNATCGPDNVTKVESFNNELLNSLK